MRPAKNHRRRACASFARCQFLTHRPAIMTIASAARRQMLAPMARRFGFFLPHQLRIALAEAANIFWRGVAPSGQGRAPARRVRPSTETPAGPVRPCVGNAGARLIARLLMAAHAVATVANAAGIAPHSPLLARCVAFGHPLATPQRRRFFAVHAFRPELSLSFP